MFFYPRGYNKPARVQGAFVSDDEVARVVEYLKSQTDGDTYDLKAQSAVEAGAAGSSSSGSPGLVDPSGVYDDLFAAAGQAVIESQKASIGMLQRRFKVGFNRAARIMDQLCDEGVVGPEEGTKPRRILMTSDEFNEMLEEENHQ
jgi:S-DNA-T family DNA segregation ATPase FtsK/SpoIIIE